MEPRGARPRLHAQAEVLLESAHGLLLPHGGRGLGAHPRAARPAGGHPFGRPVRLGRLDGGHPVVAPLRPGTSAARDRARRAHGGPGRRHLLPQDGRAPRRAGQHVGGTGRRPRRGAVAGRRGRLAAAVGQARRGSAGRAHGLHQAGDRVGRADRAHRHRRGPRLDAGPVQRPAARQGAAAGQDRPPQGLPVRRQRALGHRAGRTARDPAADEDPHRLPGAGEDRQGPGEGQGRRLRRAQVRRGAREHPARDGRARPAAALPPVRMSTQETTGTMADLVLGGAERFGDNTALKHKDGGDWVESSYSDLGGRARSIAKGLMAMGVDKGDAVAIFSDTRPEWVEADMGAACAGAVVATIYHTGSAEGARHVLDNSRSKLCFCENEDLLEKVKEVRGELSELEQLVLFEGSDDDAIGLDELVEKGEGVDDSELDSRVQDIGADDLFTLVYTSGTTGAPKGCMLTHGNFRTGLEMLDESIDIGEDAVFYAFLPLSHVLTRLIELAALHTGATLAFWQRDKDKLLEDLKEVRPTHLAAVPRIFEKIYNEAAAKAEGGIKGKVFSKAVEVGRKARERERKGESLGPVLKAEFQLADKQIFSTVRDLFGGRLELALTGAAPVAKEMLEFFDACGVLVLEGYGLTETSGGATVNLPDDFKFGTQGKALPG